MRRSLDFAILFFTALACAKVALAQAKVNALALPVFEEVTKKIGINFKHQASPTFQKLPDREYGSGVALFDYDNDGRLDIFVVNGAYNHCTTSKHDSLNPIIHVDVPMTLTTSPRLTPAPIASQ